MTDQEKLEKMHQFIKDNKIELQSIEGKSFDRLMMDIVGNQETFSQLLCLVAVITRGRYITIVDPIAAESIKAKKERKAFFLNLILDILYTLKMIKYVKIEDGLILVDITDNELAESLNKARYEMANQNEDARDLIKVIDETMKDDPRYRELKKEFEMDI